MYFIHARIYPILGNNGTQFAIKHCLGTREALFSIQILTERARDVNCDVFTRFLDYEKRFESITVKNFLPSCGINKGLLTTLLLSSKSI